MDEGEFYNTGWQPMRLAWELLVQVVKKTVVGL